MAHRPMKSGYVPPADRLPKILRLLFMEKEAAPQPRPERKP